MESGFGDISQLGTHLFLESFLPLATTGHWNVTSGIATVIVRSEVTALTGQRILTIPGMGNARKTGDGPNVREGHVTKT